MPIQNHVYLKTLSAFGLTIVYAMPIHAHEEKNAWTFGAVVDMSYTSRPLATGAREKGLQLGHSDLSANGPMGQYLKVGLVGSLATHDGKLEKELEEAWLETTQLPAGLKLTVGRFASHIGGLNQQHPHADDFSERPLLYRAFYGNHWNDDGVRLSWTAPTAIYWSVGGEVFRGKALVGEAVGTPKKWGVQTLNTKLGGDFNRSHSWQLGLSRIHNQREAEVEAHTAGHEHHHGALLSGKNTTMLDATWKWSPNGNNRQEQVRVNFEAARISGINQFATAQDKHLAHAMSVVWRFHPSWEVGARVDSLKARMPNDDPAERFHTAKLQEHSLMLAWKPSHMQTVRLQLSQQRNAEEFEAPAKRAVQLQYILAFGSHGAHAY